MASILIVDDEKSIRRTLGQFLRDDGHEVIEAQDADMALQRLTETEFAVVVTDIILPRMTGVELLRRIRATSPYVQVVMMTGEPTVETASESLRAGATDYLFKPITKEAILRVVDNAVKLKTLEDTKRRLEAENRDHRENLERLVQERARQLRASEERASELARFNQGVLDALTAHICVLAEDGTILAVNRAWDDFKTANPPLAANTGLGANYLAVCEAVVGTDKATAQEAVEGLRALARENSSEFSLEYSCHSPNTQRWFQMRATRFVMEGSTRIVVAHENITKRKRAELRISAFADLRQRLSAVKTQPEALEAIVDAADQLLPWDACSFSLYSPEENKMQHVLSLDTLEGRRVKVNPPESDSPPSPLARLVITTGSQLILKEHPHQMVPGGVPFGDTARPSASLLFAPIRDGSRVIGVMSIQSYDREAYDAEDLQLFEALADVCATALERIQAQMAERDARGLLEQAQKVAHLGSWSRGLSAGAPLFWSSEVYRIFGVSETLSTGKAQDFFARIHPEDRQRVQAASQAALERQLPYDLDHRIVRPDGTVRWVHEKAEIFRDTHGHPLRMVGVVQDITERRQLEEQLRQAQKMETIGQLAGGVAHDFNNVLAAVLLHLGLLQQSNQLSQDTAESLKELQKEALMAVNLTRQLLIFSRRELSHPKPVDLNGLIDNLLKMLRRLLGEHIEVVFQGFSGSVCLEADAGMMEQVVMNLCINSRDAMPKGGRLVLATAPVEISAEASKPESRPGSFVCLSVTDSGCGMDDNVLTHIFEPFYTTKEAGKGTGLGLATVYGIVKQHEGWIEVDSQLGKGSSFRVYLPSLKEPVEKTLPSSQAADMSGGSETVLLVEDEISVRRIAAACLRRLGYAVLEAADGAQALQLWGQHRQRINLLFSDMVMPGEMTGLELAERLWRDKADLKVILSSGYRADMAKPNSIAGHAVSYLDKPYQVAALAKVVRRCLDQPGNDGTQAEP